MICEIHLVPAEPAATVRPYTGLEGSSYERGSGSVDGARLAGRLKYSLCARTDAEGEARVRLDGLITTSLGAFVSVHAHGLSRPDGFGVMTVSFVAQAEGLRWLNGLVGAGSLAFAPQGARTLSTRAAG